jgi:hypothetical protein
MPARVTIRGYGGLFRRDWRIYSIPDGRGGRRPLPVHGGVPVRAVGYFAAAATIMTVAARLPLLGLMLEPLGWVMRYLALPGIAAFLLTRVEPEGRPAVRFLAGWIIHRIAPRSHSAGRRVLGDRDVALAESRVAVAPPAQGSSAAGRRACEQARSRFRAVVSGRRVRRSQRRTDRGAEPAVGEVLVRTVDAKTDKVVEAVP